MGQMTHHCYSDCFFVLQLFVFFYHILDLRLDEQGRVMRHTTANPNRMAKMATY